MQCTFYFTQSVEKLIKAMGLYFNIINITESKDMRHNLLKIHKIILGSVVEDSEYELFESFGAFNKNSFIDSLKILDSLKEDLTMPLLVSQITEDLAKQYIMELKKLDEKINLMLSDSKIDFMANFPKTIYIIMCEFTFGLFTLYFTNNSRYPNFKKIYSPIEKFKSNDFFINNYPEFYKYQKKAIIYFTEILNKNEVIDDL